MSGIDRSTLYRLFENLDNEMNSKQTLCVIGAAAVLGAGHSERQTQDIDVWRPASTINDRDLASATRAVGVGLNPQELMAEGIYLQTIMPASFSYRTSTMVSGPPAPRAKSFGRVPI